MSVICIILSILIVIINNMEAQCTGAYVLALILFIIGAVLQANNK